MSLFAVDPGITRVNRQRIGWARVATACGAASTVLSAVAAVLTGWWGCLLAAIIALLLVVAAYGCWRMWGWVTVTPRRHQWVMASRATAGVAVPSVGAAAVVVAVGVRLGHLTWPLAGVVVVPLVLAAIFTTLAARTA